MTHAVTDEGRDKGKQFLITEMPADQGEDWANELIFLLANAGAELPEGVAEKGMAGLAAIGVAQAILQAMRKLQYSTIRPLFAQMIECVKYKHRPEQPPQALISGVNCQIEEVATFWDLRLKWIELHTGFSMAAVRQNTAEQPPSAAPAA